MVALREAATSVCVDLDCELSGYFAHAGPCEPCSCGMNHAIAECPGPRPVQRKPCPCSRYDAKTHTTSSCPDAIAFRVHGWEDGTQILVCADHASLFLQCSPTLQAEAIVIHK